MLKYHYFIVARNYHNDGMPYSIVIVTDRQEKPMSIKSLGANQNTKPFLWFSHRFYFILSGVLKHN